MNDNDKIRQFLTGDKGECFSVCGTCGGSGNGPEMFNHYDNTPTGYYYECRDCNGTGKTQSRNLTR